MNSSRIRTRLSDSSIQAAIDYSTVPLTRYELNRRTSLGERKRCIMLFIKATCFKTKPVMTNIPLYSTRDFVRFNKNVTHNMKFFLTDSNMTIKMKKYEIETVFILEYFYNFHSIWLLKLISCCCSKAHSWIAIIENTLFQIHRQFFHIYITFFCYWFPAWSTQCSKIKFF